MSWAKWLVVQVLLGITLVVAPVLSEGKKSLAVTIPLCAAMIALTQIREARQRQHRKRTTLISKLRAVVSQLRKVTEGSHKASVWAILCDLLNNNNFRAQMELTGNAQAGELLCGNCERLFSSMGNLNGQVEHLTNSTSDEELKKNIATTQRLIIEYRRVVDDFLQFLSETKGEGQLVQNVTPFVTRVHDELADDYDRLMEDARAFGIELLEAIDIEFLNDEHLTHFRRAPILRP